MWLIIRDSDSAVMGTNYATQAPLVPAGHTAKEWHGPEPALHDPDEGIESYDPALGNPLYALLASARVDFDELADKADAEIGWLESAIDQIPTATLEELRTILRRMARENMECIKAWQYLFRRL